MMHLENLAEESGKISFVEYTPTGIFIIKIQKRKYRGKQIQTQIFQLEDEVQVIFNEHTKDVYAVLNKTKQYLYMHEDLPRFDYRDWSKYFRQSYSVSIAVLLFFSLVYPLYQYFMDDTVYYIDTAIYLSIFFIVVAIGTWIYSYLKSTSHGHQQIQPLFDALDLPLLSDRMLNSLRLINSYFYEYDNLYDLKVINELKKTMSNDEIHQKLQQEVQHINRFGLNPLETTKFEIEKVQSELNEIQIEKMISNREQPDPFLDVRVKLDQQNMYGVFDDFDFIQGRNIFALVSKYRDEKGRYLWLVYDQLKNLSLDEKLVNIFKGLNQMNLFDLENMQKIRFAIFIILSLILIFFGFLTAIIMAGIFAILYIHYWVCYRIYLKLSKPRKVYEYVADQAFTLFDIVNLKKLKNGELIQNYDERRVAPSRTGFKKENQMVD